MFNLTLIILFVLTCLHASSGNSDHVLEENSLLMVHAVSMCSLVVLSCCIVLKY